MTRTVTSLQFSNTPKQKRKQKNLDTPIHLDPRRLVRQTVFCDPQIREYSAVLENDFPASQLRLEVNRGVHLSCAIGTFWDAQLLNHPAPRIIRLGTWGVLHFLFPCFVRGEQALFFQNKAHFAESQPPQG